MSEVVLSRGDGLEEFEDEVEETSAEELASETPSIGHIQPEDTPELQEIMREREEAGRTGTYPPTEVIEAVENTSEEPSLEGIVLEEPVMKVKKGELEPIFPETTTECTVEEDGQIFKYNGKMRFIYIDHDLDLQIKIHFTKSHKTKEKKQIKISGGGFFSSPKYKTEIVEVSKNLWAIDFETWALWKQQYNTACYKRYLQINFFNQEKKLLKKELFSHLFGDFDKQIGQIYKSLTDF